MAWDPGQYLKFSDHRLRPAIDLLARVPLAAPAWVVDLGAGSGSATRLLRRRWPEARIVGIENSAEMLAAADDAADGIEWRQTDIAAWAADANADRVDLVYSNAALHWLPDHAGLFPRLMARLAPGGVLAVQMPRNFTEPSHTAVAEAARAGPWRDRLAPLLKPPPVAEPAFYHDLLAPLAARLEIWETRYFQVLEGENPVKQWTKGTWLKPFLEALDEPERSGFEDAYGRLVAAAYPRGRDGRTLFPFRRLFIVALAPA